MFCTVVSAMLAKPTSNKREIINTKAWQQSKFEQADQVAQLQLIQSQYCLFCAYCTLFHMGKSRPLRSDLDVNLRHFVLSLRKTRLI